MLPSLCVAFLTGLVAGSLLPFFPVVLLIVLLVFILILSAVERAGVIDQPKSFMGCVALCLGVIYWTGVTPPISGHARDDLSSGSSVEYTGRVVGLVQHARSRLTMVVELRRPLAVYVSHTGGAGVRSRPRTVGFHARRGDATPPDDAAYSCAV